MRGSIKRWLIGFLSLGLLGAQRSDFLHALWDLDFERAEREASFEWNASYQTWDLHRIAFFRAVFSQAESERRAFWEHTQLTERLFERQIAPTLPELAADVYLQRAILYVLEREWALAGLSAWRSWTYLRRALDKDPLTKQLKGLWEILFASIPSPYDKWLPGRPAIRYERALALLRQAAQPGSYTQFESSLLYFSVAKNFDTIAAAWLDTLRQGLFPQTPPPYLWRFLIGLHALEMGQVSQAESILTELAQRPQIRRFPYPVYWLGKIAFFRGEEAQAQSWWQQFVALQTQVHGLPAQFCWRGYLAWMRRDTMAAQRHWQQALRYEGVLWDEDVWAQRLAQQWLHSPPGATEARLWQVRWRIEAAAYEEAYKLLEPLRDTLHRLSGEERTAVYYLYGRLYHRIGNLEAARFAYYQATRQVAHQNRFMQAYAAYYLATLYEREADWHNARLYYLEAQKIAEQIQRTAIAQKARVGYQRTLPKRYPVPGETTKPSEHR